MGAPNVSRYGDSNAGSSIPLLRSPSLDLGGGVPMLIRGRICRIYAHVRFLPLAAGEHD
jgi:hypothetical protein